MNSGGGVSEKPMLEVPSPSSDPHDVTKVTPVKRRRLLPLVDLRVPGGMTSSSAELGGLPCIPVGFSASSSLGPGRRSRTPLTDLDSKFVTKSGLCGSFDVGESGSVRLTSGVKISHLSGSTSGVGGAVGGDDSVPRFPRLDQCAHFHYEYVELPPLQVVLVTEELKPLSQGGCAAVGEDNENRSLLVQVTSLGRSWVVRRTYDNFRFLDRQLHRCCYDRKFSQLPELPPEENLPGEEKETAVECTLRSYLRRLNDVAGSLITCGPVLNWLELDNRGHRLIVTDDSDINTPAVAAAYVVKRYTAQASDEISFEVGDMISVIDMPPPEESIWWRGKRGFQVGFFPCECVQVIGDKVPQAIQPQPLTLPPRSSSTPPAVAQQPHHSHLHSTSSSSSITQQPIKPVLRKHGKLIAFFRSFILSRPSRRRLKQSGILRERVFGCDLGEHLLNSGHEIPMVLKCCAEFIESHGTVDGIYRLSGITSNIQKLRNAYDEERVPDLYSDESILQDIHCVSSVLKMYFRELPNPLLTYQLYDKFVSAVMQNEDVRLLHVRDVVQQLPPPHYRTLEYLVQHLARIASHSNNTGMTPRNIAIVWAPNLLRSKDLEKGGVAALQDVGTQAVVTEYLVRYVDLIFNDKLPVFSTSTNGVEGTPRKLRPKSLAISTPTKLLSIDEARNRAFNSIKSDQKYIEVGGGPQSLPKTYHTVIDLPSRKGGSLKQKKSPMGWKTLFSKNRHQRKASTPNEISLNISDPAVTDADILTSHSSKKLRPVKSVESLVSTPVSLHSSHNLQRGDLWANQDTTPNIIKERSGSVSSQSSSIPSPRTHNRSVSHDSYFNLLERRSTSSLSPAGGVVKEEKESDVELSPESSKMFLDISELNLDFNTSEAEMKIFSEDDTLKSTSIEDTLSRSTVDMENVSISSDTIKTKEVVTSSGRDKKTLRDKLKKRFTSPSSQRKEMMSLSDSSEDSHSNSLKRASTVIKDKMVQTLSPETLRRKAESYHNLPSPSESHKSRFDRTENVSVSRNENASCLKPTNLDDKKNKGENINLDNGYREDEEPRGSIESALIDPELLDKITRMRVSPSVSASEASSASLAEATVSDNESFTLGSSSSGAALSGVNGGELKDGGEPDNTHSHSSLTTPCTPPVTIVADALFQEEIAKRGRAYNRYSDLHRDEEVVPRVNKPQRDRPSSLLGIPNTDLVSLGSSLTSPETPQGDSTFLEIQYHPLSDTTEPSTPSESQFIGSMDGDTANSLFQGTDHPRQSSPLSPDISSSSADDPLENGPVYENVELTNSLGRITNSNKIHGSNSKLTPDLETPTVEKMDDGKYENIEYNHLEPASCYNYDDSTNFGSTTVTPSYENLNTDIGVEDELTGSYKGIDSEPVHLNNPVDLHDEGEYEMYSFQEPAAEYENLEFSNVTEDNKSEVEIEGEMVYQQVKYLRQSIQEVNEILNEPSDSDSNQYTTTPSNEDRRSQLNLQPPSGEINPSEESECLDSPVTPSSSSLITEVLVLPSFSSPTESTTEDVTSPDASESQSSPKSGHHHNYSISPSNETTTIVPLLPPNSLPPFIPTLSPPSPNSSPSIIVPPIATSTPIRVINTTFVPSPRPRSQQMQVWPPVPKPRNLPILNIGSPLVSPTTPSTDSGSSPEFSPSPVNTQEIITPTNEHKIPFGSVPTQHAPRIDQRITYGSAPPHYSSKADRRPVSSPTQAQPLKFDHKITIGSPTKTQPPLIVDYKISSPIHSKQLSSIPINTLTSTKLPLVSLEERSSNEAGSAEICDMAVDDVPSVEYCKSPSGRVSYPSVFSESIAPPEAADIVTHGKVENETQKRERIEKYKEERRSYLREKYKSESFKGEKDDMLLRLKQKATSPSRQDEEEPLKHEDLKEKKSKCSSPTLGDQQHFLTPDGCVFEDTTKTVGKTLHSEESSIDKISSSSRKANLCFQSSISSHNISYKPISDKVQGSDVFKPKTEQLLHRSISEDSKVLFLKGTTNNACSGSVLPNASSKSNYSSKTSPSRTHSDSTFHRSKPTTNEITNTQVDDINVKEKVAIWSRHDVKPNSTPPEQKRDGKKGLIDSKFKSTPLSPKFVKSNVSSQGKKIPASPLRLSESSLYSSIEKCSIQELPGHPITGQIEQKSYTDSLNRKSKSPPTYSLSRPPDSSGNFVTKTDILVSGAVSKAKPDSTSIRKTLIVKSPPVQLSGNPPTRSVKSPPPAVLGKKSILVSQKSEIGLTESILPPPPLKTRRSYSVGTPLTGMPSGMSLRVGTSSIQQKSIKDMKAIFEKENQSQCIVKPLMVKQTSKTGN